MNLRVNPWVKTNPHESPCSMNLPCTLRRNSSPHWIPSFQSALSLREGGGVRCSLEIRPFSPGSLNDFLDAPQNNLPAQSTIVNLLPKLKSVLKDVLHRYRNLSYFCLTEAALTALLLGLVTWSSRFFIFCMVLYIWGVQGDPRPKI